MQVKKKILCYFQQAGGANALLPLLEQLKQSYNITISARDVICENLKGRNIAAYSLSELIQEKTLSGFFKDLSPSLLLTDTISLKRIPEPERCISLWNLAKKNNVPSIAYIDVWSNYLERFSGDASKKTEAMPDKIALVDSIMKEKMLSLGFQEDKLVICGNPHFSKLIAMRDKNKRSDILNNKNIPKNNFTIGFASEPIERCQGPNAMEKWGFTELTILELLIQTLNSYPDGIKKQLTLIIMFHPEDNRKKLQALIKKLNPEFQLSYSMNESTLELLSITDLLIGMSSILLLESVILQRPTLSVQINPKLEESLITNILGITECIKDKENLQHRLLELISNPTARSKLLEKQSQLQVNENSLLQWQSEIEKLLNP